MRIVTVILLVGVMVLGLVGGPALGQTCDNTFLPDVGVWQDPLAWFTGLPPTVDEVACIPAGKTCVIEFDGEQYDAEAKAIVVASDATQGDARLELELHQTLTISEDSTIDGVLFMNGKTVLFIKENLRITGNGGEIVAQREDFDAQPLIADVPGQEGQKYLTILSATPGARETSLVVHGDLDILVHLRNHAYVIADSKQELGLRGYLKTSGTAGHWIAESGSHHGRLRVDVEVRGTGEWVVQDNLIVRIYINAVCNLLSGPVNLTDGRLVANENFLTTGNLSMKSVAGSVPVVYVEEGRMVFFGE